MLQRSQRLRFARFCLLLFSYLITARIALAQIEKRLVYVVGTAAGASSLNTLLSQGWDCSFISSFLPVPAATGGWIAAVYKHSPANVQKAAWVPSGASGAQSLQPLLTDWSVERISEGSSGPGAGAVAILVPNPGGAMKSKAVWLPGTAAAVGSVQPLLDQGWDLGPGTRVAYSNWPDSGGWTAILVYQGGAPKRAAFIPRGSADNLDALLAQGWSIYHIFTGSTATAGGWLVTLTK